ncbi:unnamed protein product [Ilex paraguariensis]|uniref:Ferrochelatase n=1 Tax=Ilex paraguariensis TaxID=185542 RepID=A0ABC8TAM9_9AQUA
MDAATSSRFLPQMKLAGSDLRCLNRNSSSFCPQTRQAMPTCCGSSGGKQFLDIATCEGSISCFDSTDKESRVLGGLAHDFPVQKRNPVGKTFCSAEVCTYPGSAIESHSHTSEEKIGVLLLNLGGPETLHDVQPFLFNLFADPDIIRLPRLFRFLQQPLAQLISVLRAPKSKEGYAAIGGGSPLRKITDEQANALKMALEAKEVPANVYVAMRYWHPFTEEAVKQIKRDRVTKLVVLPLYPQYSISTTGSSIRVLQSIFSPGINEKVISILWADLIEKELKIFSKPEEALIFFSAHGVPVSYVEDAGDPYRDQMQECIHLIMEELKSRGIKNDHTLAYQPYTDEVLVELGQKGVKNLLAVPVSFVSEHIETLEEIDMEYKHLALESGIENSGAEFLL